MTDFTWNISFQLTGTYLPAGGSTTSNVTATVTGTIVTDSDSGILQQSDFGAWSFTYSAPAVGFSGSVSGDQSVLALAGSVFSASGDTLFYVFDPVTSNAVAFFTNAPSQVAFGIDLSFHNFVQGDIRLQDASFDQLDAIVTQPFQIGTEVVATLSSISEINTTDINLDLSAIFNVGGDVTISSNDQLVSIDLSNLLSVGGNFTLTNNGALLTISLPNLSEVGGNLAVSNDPSLTTISAGSLTTISGNADFSNDLSLTTISAGSLTTISGNADFSNDLSLTTISAGSLTTISGNATFSGDTSLITIDLGALLQAGAIVVSNDGVVTLDLSALVQAGGDVSITDNTHLLMVDLPSLTTVSGDVTISGDSSVTNIDVGSLISVSGSVSITDNMSATTIDAGSLTSVSGDVTITSGADATLDASALGPGGGTVKLIGDNLTTTITLGSLAHMDGTLTISSADGVALTAHAGLADLAIDGTGADNILIGSATADNTIDGKLGNDLMTGGRGDDTFVFDFSVSQHTDVHHDFISLADVTSVTVDGITYDRPASTASITAWSNWNNELTSWANSQTNNNGGDDFNFFTNTNPGGSHHPGTVGTIQLIDGYFHNSNTIVTDVAGDGFDTITNFANQALTTTNGGSGNDALLFHGLSDDPTAANYWANVLSSTTANGNTTIHVHDVANHGADVSAITLVGVTTNIDALVHNGSVQFDHAGWLI